MNKIKAHLNQEVKVSKGVWYGLWLCWLLFTIDNVMGILK